MNSSAAAAAEGAYFFTPHSISRGGDFDPKMGSSDAAAEGGFRDGQGDQADEVYGRRKKRRAEETTIVSVLESTSRALESALVRVAEAQIDAYNRNSELDRMQRQTINESLVGVLEKLAESITRVAERL